MNLRDFYENNYERSVSVAGLPRDDDFMYGLVLGQIRAFLKKGMQVLDLGCNNGNLSLYMAMAGCDVTGIDLAQNAVNTATKSAAHWNLSNVQFMQMDFLKDWQDPQVLDFVLCNHVIEHIPDDERMLKKIHFATKPGGRLLLMAPTIYSSLYRTYKFILGKFSWDEEVGHLRRYDWKNFTEMVEKSGFEVEKVVFLDSLLREWFILFKPLRWTCRFWDRRFIRNIFNSMDKFLARYLFPATICIHARRPL